MGPAWKFSAGPNIFCTIQSCGGGTAPPGAGPHLRKAPGNATRSPGKRKRHDRPIPAPRPGIRAAAAEPRGARGGAPRHRRAALPQPPPVPPAAARRQALEGSGAGLGTQPLLLPGDDPGEGRGAARPPAGRAAAPDLAPAHRRSRRRLRGRRWHRALAEARGRRGLRPRLRALDQGHPVRDPLLGRCLCPLRLRALAPGGDRLLADRDVLADDHLRARRRDAEEL
ncbi:hypothetical protein CHKEEEPN_3833 [Methylorubrum podarium]|nr:hypothetical protein CHKEEEPN_3833 [Methylorubrum podarium]